MECLSCQCSVRKLVGRGRSTSYARDYMITDNDMLRACYSFANLIGEGFAKVTDARLLGRSICFRCVVSIIDIFRKIPP